MICENCGAEIEDDSAFCGYCGAKGIKDNNRIFCGHCGSIIANDDAFCPVCGASTGTEPTTSGNNENIENNDEDDGIYCKNCGMELFKTDAVCPSCGKIVDEFNNEKTVPMQEVYGNNVQQPEQNSTYQSHVNTNIQKKQNNLGVILAVVISLIVIAASGIVIGYVLTHNDSDKVDESTQAQITEQEDEDEEPRRKSARKSRSSDEEDEDEPTERPRRSATEEPTEEATEYVRESESEYLFDSYNTYITEEYLDGCTQSEVRLILNEMYARHGYVFKNEEYRNYFEGKSWYTPRYDSQDEAQAWFNKYEEANRIAIIDYEESKGWR